MELINLNFSYIKLVGDISESRRALLRDGFPEFPEILQPEPNVLVFKKDKSALVINQDRITYATSGESTEVQLSNIVEVLNRANQILGLNNSARIIFVFEGTEIGQNGPSLESSKALHRDEASILFAKGIGYRFIVDKDTIQGEIRIEPFIKDDNKIFCSAGLQTKDVVSVTNATVIFEEMYDLGLIKAEQVSSILL